MSLNTFRDYRTRPQWAEIREAVFNNELEIASMLTVRYGFFAKDICSNKLRDTREGITSPSWEELILLTEKAATRRL